MTDLTFPDWQVAFTAVSEMTKQYDSTGRICEEYFRGLTDTNPGFEPVTADEINQWYRHCCDHQMRQRPSLGQIKQFVQELRTANQPRLPPTKITDECASRRYYQAVVTYLSRGECQMFEGLLSGQGILGAGIRSILTGRIPPRKEVIATAERIRSQFPDERWTMFRHIPGPGGGQWVDYEIHDAIYKAVQEYRPNMPRMTPNEWN